jgi:hypothetical protein
MYTEAQIKTMVESYNKGNTYVERKAIIDRLAVEIGQSARSIIGKLGSLGIYKKKTKSKTSTTLLKAELVNAVRISLGARDNELKSLSNATRSDLEVIMNQIRVLSNARELLV